MAIAINELRQLGECKVVAQTEAIPFLPEINPEHCYTSWDIFLTTTRGYDAIADVFIFVADDSELTIQVIDDGLRRSTTKSWAKSWWSGATWIKTACGYRSSAG